MTKITPEHLERGAVVYVRQSTAFQVARNLESQRRQYGLSERARQLGWSDVEVIDDDLGRSGAGARRPGFEKLLAAICEGRVGAVLSLEASRLARNGRDWHTLLEFCGLVRTLIVDEDAIYDPASPNDRLLLAMKGTMSEMELSVFRQRSIEAMKQKARRGELFLTVAVGYVKAGNDRIEKDADQRVQEAMALVFRKFAELQTIRQVLVWCRQEKVVLPALGNAQTTDRIIWRLPVYSTVHHMLTNPVYAGACAFGRRSARVTAGIVRDARIVFGHRRQPARNGVSNGGLETTTRQHQAGIQQHQAWGQAVVPGAMRHEGGKRGTNRPTGAVGGHPRAGPGEGTARRGRVQQRNLPAGGIGQHPASIPASSCRNSTSPSPSGANSRRPRAPNPTMANRPAGSGWRRFHNVVTRASASSLRCRPVSPGASRPGATLALA